MLHGNLTVVVSSAILLTFRSQTLRTALFIYTIAEEHSIFFNPVTCACCLSYDIETPCGLHDRGRKRFGHPLPGLCLRLFVHSSGLVLFILLGSFVSSRRLGWLACPSTFLTVADRTFSSAPELRARPGHLVGASAMIRSSSLDDPIGMEMLALEPESCTSKLVSANRAYKTIADAERLPMSHTKFFVSMLNRLCFDVCPPSQPKSRV